MTIRETLEAKWVARDSQLAQYEAELEAQKAESRAKYIRLIAEKLEDRGAVSEESAWYYAEIAIDALEADGVLLDVRLSPNTEVYSYE